MVHFKNFFTMNNLLNASKYYQTQFSAISTFKLCAIKTTVIYYELKAKTTSKPQKKTAAPTRAGISKVILCQFTFSRQPPGNRDKSKQTADDSEERSKKLLRMKETRFLDGRV